MPTDPEEEAGVVTVSADEIEQAQSIGESDAEASQDDVDVAEDDATDETVE